MMVLRKAKDLKRDNAVSFNQSVDYLFTVIANNPFKGQQQLILENTREKIVVIAQPNDLINCQIKIVERNAK